MKNKQKQLYIGPTIEHIVSSDVLFWQANDLVLFGKRNLMIMNRETKIMTNAKIQDEKIFHTAYHPSLNIYFINTDKGLVYLNGDGQVIKKQRISQILEAKFVFVLQMEDGYEGVPNYRKDQLLYITNENMYMGEFCTFHERGMVKNKNICDISIEFSKKPSIILDAPEWVGNVKHLKKISTLICWNPSQAYVFILPKTRYESITTHLVYTKISKRQNKINDFEISLKHKFLLVGYQFGTIKVYKYDETKKYVSQLRGHQRQCTTLFISEQNQNFVYSGGLDSTIRIWDLLDFNELYQIKIDIIIDEIHLLSEKLAFIKFDDKRKSCLCQLNLNLLQPILNEGNSGNLVSLMSDGSWGIALYSNNYAECFELQKFSRTEKIQFPLKYGSLRDSLKFNQNCYIICVEKGFSIIHLKKEQIDSINFDLKRLVYAHSLRQNQKQKKNVKFIEMIHEKLLDTFLFSTLEDWQAIPFLVNVSSVTLLFQILLPMYDINIPGKNVTQKKDFVILGTDKGYIYFVDLKNRQKFYTRLNYHSNKILKICKLDLTNQKKNEHNFFSLTDSNEFCIWSLSVDAPPKLKCRISYSDQVSVIQPFNTYILVGFQNGRFMVIKVSEIDDELYFECDSTNTESGHLRRIISVDFLDYKGYHIFLTTGEDKVLKIWVGLRKQLLYEIKLFNEVNNSIFLKQELDLVVSHGENNQISLLRNSKNKSINLAEKIKDLVLDENVVQIDIKKQLGIKEQKKILRISSPKSARKRSKSPENLRQKSKIQNKSSFMENNLVRIIQQSQTKMSRSVDIRGIESPIIKRKERLDRYKMSNIEKNESLFLPKLPTRQHYKKTQFFGDSSSRGARILEKVQVMKSFSQAGRKQF